MKRKIRIIVANPAGNITIFVKDRMGRDVYQKVASQLLDMEELKGEQVAFMHDAPECGRAEGIWKCADLSSAAMLPDLTVSSVQRKWASKEKERFSWMPAAAVKFSL